MLRTIIDWINKLWRDDVEPTIEQIAWDDYEYLRLKYGITQSFIDDEDDKEDTCSK